MLIEIPDLLEWQEVKKIRATLDKCEFVDGKLTAGFRAKQVKNNLQLKKERGQTDEIERMVLDAFWRNAEFGRAAIPRTIRPPLFSRYEADMAYGMHVDDALMGRGPKDRADLSVTVFLSDPDRYDGGQLEIHGPFGAVEIKLPAGAAAVYPSSTVHRVVPVTRGERLAVVTWVQSYVRDAAQREVLHDIDRIRRVLTEFRPEADETELAYKTYANLLRMWSDT